MIALGCTSMTPHSYPDSPRRAEMVDVLRGAVEAGVELFDTSEIQGPFTGEEMLGDALGNRARVLTKFGWEIEGGKPTGALNSRPEVIRASAHGSLRRLKRERLDVYMQHRVDQDVPIEEVAGTVKELIDAGDVAAFGLCEASPETIRRAHKVCPVKYLEYEYSIFSRDVEEEIIPLARELGAEFMAYSPLAKGLLAGRSEPDDDSSSPRLHSANFAANKQLAQEVAAAVPGRNDSEIALGWLLAKDVVPIAGSTNLARIKENLAVTALSAQECEAIDEVLSRKPVQGARLTQLHEGFVDKGRR
ncbi:oxidoreductase [Corynebacterium striatum]|nr:aldo/keto reductase [Corynebacterium striatum]STD56889.1 oxidoreductase [Corynebacterium striatum]